MDLKCPKCGSEDVFQKKDGSCLCGECGHRFMPQQEPAEFVPMRLFISYGHKESEICRRIYQALKDRGHDPWFDERRICFGNDWRERIANGIEKSGSVVACLSQYSTREKGVCLDELAISVGVRVEILSASCWKMSTLRHRSAINSGWICEAGKKKWRPGRMCLLRGLMPKWRSCTPCWKARKTGSSAVRSRS